MRQYPHEHPTPNDGHYSTKTYAKQLAKWSIRLIDLPIDLSKAEWRGKYPSAEWLDRTVIAIFKEYEFSIDGVQMLFRPENWRSNAPSIQGVHFGKPRNGYEVGIIKYRRRWEDSARHELMHAFDDFVYTYTGASLSKTIGVRDWDEDVVHGRAPGYEEYEYDQAYSVIAPTVREALNRRDLWFLRQPRSTSAGALICVSRFAVSQETPSAQLGGVAMPQYDAHLRPQG